MEHGEHNAQAQHGGGHGTYFTTQTPTHLVFQSWTIDDAGDYHMAVALTFMLSALLIWLRFHRAREEVKLQAAFSNGYECGGRV